MKGLKAMWNKKTPREKFQVIYDVGSLGSSTIQLNTFTTLKLGLMSYVLGGVGVIYYAAVVFTVYFYSSRGQFQDSLPSFCMLGMITAVSDRNWNENKKLNLIKYVLFEGIHYVLRLCE